MLRLSACYAVAGVVLLGLKVPAPVVAPAGDLQTTLARLDAASQRFSSAEAKIHTEHYLAVIKDVDEKQDGSFFVIRGKDGKTEMGLKTEGAQGRTFDYSNGTARDYVPAANCYNVINKPGVDTYLSLGFGGSGKDLAKAWSINDLGPEEMGAVKTEKLDLTPMDAGVKANVTHVTTWIDLDRDVTLKVVFYSPSRDTQTATYMDIRLNKKVDAAKYAIKGKACH